MSSRWVQPGRVHRSVYVDPQIFELEMDHLFGRAWLVLGHQSMLAPNGGWFTARMGREPVVVYRADDAIRVFINRCPHRGAAICPQGRGAARRLQCAYHGWTFDGTGKLLAVPAREEYSPELFEGTANLTQVPRVEVYRGFIFASLAADGPDLLSFLGEARSIIDEFVDRAPLDDLEAIQTVHRHSYRGNWKMQFENLNDTVHPAFSHASSIAAAQDALARHGEPGMTPELGVMLANGQPISFFQSNEMVVTDFGHSFIDGHIGAGEDSPLKQAYRATMAEHRGPAEADRILGQNRHLLLLYPSSTWQARFQTLKLILPISVDRTDTVTYVFRLKGAPDGMLDIAIPYANMANSPASPIIADDLELYERCMLGNSTQRAEWIPTSRATDKRLPSGGHPATSEAYIRNQFATWSRYMTEAGAG